MAVTMVDLGSVIGPQGPKGDKGDPGEPGPQGPAGADGKDATVNVSKFYTKKEISNSTSLKSTGMSVTIPANCRFAISAYQDYNYAVPQQTALSMSSTSGSSFNLYASGICTCTYAGYTNKAFTAYMFIKGNTTSGTNECSLYGWYEPV